MARIGARDPGRVQDAWWLAVLGMALGVYLVVSVGAQVALLLGTDQPVPGDPFTALTRACTGQLRWTGGATAVAVAEALVVVVVSTVVTHRLVRHRRGRTRVDADAKYLGRLRDVRSLTEKECRAKARKLGVQLPAGAPPGVPIGRHRPSGAPLYGSYEDTHIDIWGPRLGKTTARVIPAILAAPGPVLSTSNKRDVVDATRGVREEQTGCRPYIFDPQGVVKEPPTWWWNPLTWVLDGVGDPAEVKAAMLAQLFADGDDGQDARRDAFFDPEGQDLLAALLLAAAVGGRPITRVYEWSTDPLDRDPVKILQRSGRFQTTAAGLMSQFTAPEKQRSGVFSTCKKMARALKMPNIAPWVTDDGSERPQFDPHAFVRSRQTLYSLSMEGIGSAGPLVAALTVAVIDAAMARSSVSPKGRLPVPLVGALDEAANVVRWRQLPSLYSHFGSRGILLMTVLQSWSQGVEVWGEAGMRKLWSAANVKFYGGGVAVDDGEFLSKMSTAIGDHWALQTSVSAGGRRSSNTSATERRTYKESDLEAWPRGRGIVRSSGNRAVIVDTVPWFEGPHRAAVEASLAKYEPKNPPPETDNGTEPAAAAAEGAEEL